ncbi:MAG: hypothetical protein FJZ90_09565 [Chloroflexi bacterium]|nr:hypothetical protein [Chloroflexota bacterium]
MTIRDRGAYYELALDAPLDSETLEVFAGPYTPIVALVTAKNAKAMPGDLPELAKVYYERERDLRAEYFAVLGSLKLEVRRAVWRGESPPEADALDGLRPHQHWDIFRAINPAALVGYNKLALQWWQVQEALPQVLGILRDLFAVTPNNTAAAETAWKALDKEYGWGISATTTSGQIFNPAMGKGQNRPKADRLSMGNVSSFWLVEFLNAVGFYRAAITTQLRGSKDRKTYVLAPVELSLADHEKVFDEFRKAMRRVEPAVRSDILASLRYARALVEYARKDEGRSVLRRYIQVARPDRIVAGFASAFYKSLGNSAATMNLPFVGLPGWLRVRSADDLVSALAILSEHEAVVQPLDESHSDAYDLLLAYRDFCSGDDLEAFFAFCVGYSSYLIGQRERNRYAFQFTTDNLRRLIMSSEPKLTPIIENDGFQSIAYAIRQSTVVAQYRKQQGDRRYDVRYGLGQQLARKSHYPDAFIAELSDFLHRYNAENAQVMESRPGPYRRSVRTTDLDAIVRLVDEYGSETICNLLIAYGYARTPREPGLQEMKGEELDQPDSDQEDVESEEQTE